MESLLRRRATQFRAWWSQPAIGRDRFLGAFVGVFAGLWIGALARIMLGDLPVSFADVLDYALLGAGAGLLLGLVFPKAVLVIGYPFMSLG